MKKSLYARQLAAFAAASAGGVLLHFLYDWTNRNAFAALFSAVNESTWEHMKLLFFPMAVFAVVQSFFFREYKNYWCVKLVGTVTGVVLIPVLFYTLNGAFGKTPDFVNIAIFFVSAAVGCLLETRLFKNNRLNCRFPWLCILALCLIGLLFAVFTFQTPHISLFRDPLSGCYGING